MSFDSSDPARRLGKRLNCPACSGAGEEYFANGYVCKICGRRESLLLKDIACDLIRREPDISDHLADAFSNQNITMKNRTITNEGMNRIGDTIADLRMELSRLRKIEAAAVAAVEYEQWQGDTWYDLMIDLQKALHESKVGADGTAV